MRLLLEHGADLDARDNSNPYVAASCDATKLEAIRVLIEHGEDVDLEDNVGI